jgi:hypothetical protein
MTPIERFDGLTPAGGAYADVITVGDQVEIVEYDQDGRVIARTYGTTSSRQASEEEV